jgi:diadenosine tetraphosphate (Ap4A) HIT family hydrolase
MTPDRWTVLKAGDGCVICGDAHLEENPFGYLVVELEHSFVRLAKNQYMRGWTTVTLKRHANELWELSDEELAGFWREVAHVGRALDLVYQPAKLNYGVFGNLCPHLHCHLIPRTYADDPTKPLNMNEQEVWLSPPEYAAAIGALRRALER